ncbi:MAG TPA: carboxypeptidase-like regulatory domain-containing protein [Segetibacter sp.]|jgi:hypothetical protein
MRYISSIFFVVLASLSFIAFAQSSTIKGKVLLPTGEPAPNVSVVVKGTSKRTVTNSNGTFSLVVSKLPATLIFTVAGYNSLEYKVTEKNKSALIQVTLSVSKTALDEVVVTGYAPGKKRSFAGSASTISEVSLSGRASAITESYDKVYTRTDRTRPSSAPTTTKTSALKDKTESREIKETHTEITTENSRVALTKMLTAGEISDFKKWKLWGDYTEQDFKVWSKHWGIAPKQRYCVQVQNQDHKAIVGQKVYLLNNSTKDTVWQAVTDNTGKAELWAALHNSDDRSSYYITCDKELISSPAEFENGINRITLKRSCTVSNIVDIAFVVDATGSMGDEIRYLQEELQDVIGKTAAKYKDVQLHSGAVFYRDRADEYLTRHINFQTDPLQLINFIKHQSAGGGGDFPEAVEDALSTALDSLQWHKDARAKILFLVLDAPPHDAAKDKINSLVKRAAIKGIRVVPIVCSGIDKSTEYLMRCIALATNGSYVFLTDDSGIGNPHIKPTTDEFKVELLNDLLPRLIGDMIYVPSCNEKQNIAEPVISKVDTTIIVVYPNPTQGNITIQSSQELKEVFITDFTGKVLMKVLPVVKGGRVQASLSNYPSGTYLVKYYIEGKGWGIEKVLLVH